MAADTAPDIYPPRYFWRRLIAYGIDAALVWIVVALLMGLFLDDTVGDDLADPTVNYTFGLAMNLGEFRPPFTIGTTTCGKPTGSLPVLQDYVAPATITNAEICFVRSYGMPVGGEATVTLADTPEAGNLGGQTITLPLTIETGFRFVDSFSLITFVAFCVVSLWVFGITPGKKLMLLRVVGRKPIPALRREIMKMLPYLLTVPTLAAMNEAVSNMPLVPSFVQFLAGSLEVLSLGSFAVLWLWPLVRWRGAFFHDRWLGLSVVELDDLLPLPPEDAGDRPEGDHS